MSQNQALTLGPEHAHYLTNVMRIKVGDEVRLFNGRDGEWAGKIAAASKRSVEIALSSQLKPQKGEPDLWLCCAPIKKAHFDYMVEKATELGVAVIQPILTSRTQIRDVNVERCLSIAREAAEQSERLGVPEIKSPIEIAKLAATWSKDRALIVCAEWGDAVPVKESFAQMKNTQKAAIVTGPEGGFSAEELELLRHIANSAFIHLGPRILRADTAAIAALSCWQAACGDWN
jgi:16S rRNA (uracil1498-N3)-methyltransferase